MGKQHPKMVTTTSTKVKCSGCPGREIQITRGSARFGKGIRPLVRLACSPSAASAFATGWLWSDCSVRLNWPPMMVEFSPFCQQNKGRLLLAKFGFSQVWGPLTIGHRRSSACMAPLAWLEDQKGDPINREERNSEFGWQQEVALLLKTNLWIFNQGNYWEMENECVSFLIYSVFFF